MKCRSALAGKSSRSSLSASERRGPMRLLKLGTMPWPLAGLRPGFAQALGQFGHELVQGGSANLAVAADVTVCAPGPKPVADRGHLPIGRTEQIPRPFREPGLAPPQLQRPRKRMTMHGRAPRAHHARATARSSRHKRYPSIQRELGRAPTRRDP
jgi:hypothetical protein